MGWGGWIYFFGAIASTIYAYNWSTYLAEKAFLMLVPASVADYVEYANDYLPAVAKKFYTKVMVLQSLVEAIVMFGTNLALLWAFNTVLLQVLISWECYKINFTTVKIAAKNALAGAISASVILFIWNLITLIPFPITKILIAIEGFPFIGWLVMPFILLVFNLSFGAIGKAVALSQGCAAGEPAVKEDEGFGNWAHTLRSGGDSGDAGTTTTAGTPGICQYRPFAVCNNAQDHIIPLRSNYNLQTV